MRFAVRRDVGGWSPVFMALLMLLIMILFFGLITPPTTISIGVAKTRTPDGTNWTLTFTAVPTGLTQNATTLSLTSANGIALLNATSLYALKSPGRDEVVYFPLQSSPLVSAGDHVTAAVSRYPTGTRWSIANAGRILASGTFQ